MKTDPLGYPFVVELIYSAVDLQTGHMAKVKPDVLVTPIPRDGNG